MSVYGIDGDRFDRNGVPYMHVGDAETDDGAKAFEIARRYAASHPNASAQIHRNGDPYAWVFHAYDLGKDETVIAIQYCGTGHTKRIVNGKTVHDSSASYGVVSEGWGA